MRIVSYRESQSYINSAGNRIHHARRANVNKFCAIDGEGERTFIGYVNQSPQIEHRYVMLDIGGSQIVDRFSRHVVDCGNGKTRIVHGLEFTQILEHLYKQYDKETAFIGFYLGYDFSQWLKTLPFNRAYYLVTKEGIAKRKKRSPNRFPFPVEYRGWEFDILDKKRFKFRKCYCQCEDTWNCAKRKCERGPWMNICDSGPFYQTSFMNAINPKKWQKSGSMDLDPVLTWSPERDHMTYEELRHERLCNRRYGSQRELSEYDKLKIGKDRRSNAQADAEMAEYNQLENEVLARSMGRLNAAFKSIGVYLPAYKWYGPGAAAEYWLEHIAKLPHSYPTKTKAGLLDSVSQWALDAAQSTYFGGWFCIQMHGHVPGITWEYDINSAYPYVITNLPCLEHGQWSQGNGIPNLNDDDIAFVYANVKSCSPSSEEWHKPCHIGTMLHRREDMSILRPMVTEGWYVWSELQSAIKAGLITGIEYGEWISYQQECDHKPLAKVGELYDKRIEVGKESPLGKALKLLYNSMYGKFAQSIGMPKFGNPIYATLITSGCRKQIIDAIATHPYGAAHVAMVATDGVYFVSPHTQIDAEIEEFLSINPNKKEDDRLGKWGRKPKTNLTLFKPGVYWDDDTRKKYKMGQDAQFKSRGVSPIDMLPFIEPIDKEFSAWGESPPKSSSYLFINKNEDYTGWPIAEINVRFAMVSAKQAMHRNDWSLAGEDISSGMKVIHSSDPESKRDNLYVDYLPDGRRIYRSQEYQYPAEKWKRMIYREECLLDSDEVQSMPYVKRFGMDDPFSDEYEEQWGETAEGTIAQMLNWELMD